MPHKLRGSYLLGPAIVAVALFFPASLPAAQNRVVQALGTGESRSVAGNVHRLARPEFDQGRAAGEMMLHRMVLTFKPSAAQQADLDALLIEQQNPVSPYYHQWLTPEQFADRFAVSESDIAKVTDWLQAQGFTVDEVARSRTYVAFSGTAAQVQSAFGTEIHRFQVSGEAHYANVSDPSLPAPLADFVIGVRGLDDFRPRARAVRRSPRPEFTSDKTGNHYLAPDDLATIYDLKALYSSGIDGTGQSLAVMGQTDLIMADITTFRSLSGLPANTPTVTLVPGSADPGVVNDDLSEADLDIEWAGAVARNAHIIYVNSKNAFNSMQYAVSANVAPVVGISYGDCEPNFSASEMATLTSMGQQANAQGQTIVGPSGDSGAADCDYPTSPNATVKTATHGLTVDIPAALPYVTGVGGTIFNEGSGTYWNAANNASNGSALSYIPETGWNDTALEIANGGSLAASGGGASQLFPKPFWQTGAGVPDDLHRDVPDISVAGSFDHDGYLVCSNGSCVNGFRAADNSLFVVGGTSAGAQVFAGLVALLNQKMAAPQGNVNPRLYALAASSPNAFHDITTGDNKVPCTAGSTNCPAGTTSIGYSAGPGYDLVTGLGSVDAFNLVTAWAQPDFQASISPASLSLTAGASSNVGTLTLTIAALNGFTGSISLACSVPSSLPGTTCTVSPTSLTNGGSVTVTVTAPTTRTVNLRAPHLFPHFFPGSGATFAMALGLVMAGKGERASRKKSLVILALLLIVGVGMMIGCGGGGSSSSAQTTSSSSSSTPVTGTGAVKVTATSGPLSRTVTTMVTVN